MAAPENLRLSREDRLSAKYVPRKKQSELMASDREAGSAQVLAGTYMIRFTYLADTLNSGRRLIMVTPARFERATFPSGGRPTHTRQAF